MDFVFLVTVKPMRGSSLRASRVEVTYDCYMQQFCVVRTVLIDKKSAQFVEQSVSKSTVLSNNVCFPGCEHSQSGMFICCQRLFDFIQSWLSVNILSKPKTNTLTVDVVLQVEALVAMLIEIDYRSHEILLLYNNIVAYIITECVQ